MNDPLAAMAATQPGAPATIHADGSYTYRELDMQAQQCAARLSAEGIASGDFVGIALTPSPRYIALLLALFRLGAIACPISTRLPQEGLRDALDALRVTALISDRSYASVNTKHIDISMLFEKSENERSVPPKQRNHGPSDIALVLATSGSSGPPKFAAHTLSALVQNAKASNENISVIPGDRWLLSLPLYHVGGLGILFRCLLGGAAIVLPEDGEDLAGSIQQYKPTHISLVATQLYRLLRDNVDLSGLKAILLGGSAMPESLVRDALDRGLPVYTSYGLTEMASQVTTTCPGDSAEHLLSSGKPLSAGTLSISDENEILVGGDTLFQGYLRDGELSRPLDQGGWFATGDLGRIDQEGYLHVTGRKDNLFISGGENIQPEEIEAALCAIDTVESAIVVPVDDAEFGQRPVAFIRSAAQQPPTASEILAELEKNLPRFKLPVAIHPWPDDMVEAGIKASRAAFQERARKLTART